MVTNGFENGNFMQPMGGLSMHSRWALFFPLGVRWGGVRGVFFFSLPCSQCVPNMFSSRSLETPQVHKLFPKACSTALRFYPIWFAQSSILMYINCWGINLFLFYNWGSEEVLPLGSAQCSKKNVDGGKEL